MRKFCTTVLLVLLVTYCKESADTPPSTQSSTPAASGSNRHYVNVKDGLNVRSSPSMTGAKVGMLRRGTEVLAYERSGAAFTVDGISGNWIRITSGSVKGWAFDGFLSTSKPIDDKASGSTTPDSSSALSAALAKVADGSCINADKFSLFSEEFYKHGRDPYARNGASGLVIDFGRGIFEATDGHEMCSGTLQATHKLDEKHYQLNLKSNATASECKNDFQIDLTLYPNHLIVAGPLAHPGKYICLRVTEH